MSLVEVDISEVTDLTTEAQREFKRLSGRMFGIANRQASAERRNHIWNNITGLLEENTRAHLIDDGADNAEVLMAQQRDYASFVADRGRNEFPTRAQNADDQMRVMIADIGKRLESK